VKIKNSTPWCSLYYSELRYNINISPSAHRAIFNLLFYVGFSYIALTIFIGFKLWLGLLITLVLVLFIFLFQQLPVLVINKWLKLFTSSEDKNATSFVLSDTGECQFSGQAALQISANSQINLWGYWLVFSANNFADTQYFIFKDSLSCEDQARLARSIMRAQR